MIINAQYNASNTISVIWLPQAGGIPQQIFSLVSLLSKNYNILSVDYKPSGVDSYGFDDIVKNTVTTLIQMNLKKIILVGSSLGGYLAYKIAHSLEQQKNLTIIKLYMFGVSDFSKLTFKKHEKDFVKNIITGSLDNADFLHSRDFYNFIKEKITSDLSILDNLEVLKDLVINTTINLFFGTNDKICNPHESTLYWTKKTKSKVITKMYEGGHIPDFQTIAFFAFANQQNEEV